ncbi:hypothetical protein [Desertibaculum subflavum]|uniref:hypothetical protein n=1 Tax=Desertibaculum subflavum TaxID=2268458 RepID=UPI000E66FBFD
MSKSNTEAGLRISVIGAFRVRCSGGIDLAPRGSKARALLALLALAPACRRSRAALQDKLWSTRAPEQGAGSLRQALSEIRRAFGPKFRDCLVTDLRSVALNTSRVTVDVEVADLAHLASGTELPTLLEDIEIDEREFEHWVRNQRAAFEQRLLAMRSAPTPQAPVVRRDRPSARSWICLLPPASATGESGQFLSRLIGGRIGQGLADQWGVDICDMPKQSPGMQLRVDSLALAQSVSVIVTLLAADGTTQLWTAGETIPLGDGFVADSPRLQTLANRTIQVAGHQLRQMNDSNETAQAFTLAFDAVKRMYRVDIEQVDHADILLAQAYDIEPKAVYLAWRAYARTFYVGEHVSKDRRARIEEAEELARHALELAPQNATVLALVSYVYSFAFRKYAVGHDLAEQSIRFEASQPLGRAFLGRTKSYLGKHDDGYLLTCQGRELSAQAPYHYKLHFLCGVTAMLAGHLEEAVRATEIAHVMAPAYRPPMRYLVPLYLRSGERDKARNVYEQLRRLEPSFSLESLRETSYPSTAIRELGLLSFSERDL